MKRSFSLILVALIGALLATDVGLLMKHYQTPEAFALLEKVSSIHYLLLHKVGYLFASIKTLFSALLLIMWMRVLVYPAKAIALMYATTAYAVMWLLIGALILTGVVGVLQYSAGMPVNVVDLSLLVPTMPLRIRSWYMLMMVGIPSLLLVLPMLHNRSFASVDV